jgi:hypothetical protein
VFFWGEGDRFFKWLYLLAESGNLLHRLLADEAGSNDADVLVLEEDALEAGRINIETGATTFSTTTLSIMTLGILSRFVTPT